MVQVQEFREKSLNSSEFRITSYFGKPYEFNWFIEYNNYNRNIIIITCEQCGSLDYLSPTIIIIIIFIRINNYNYSIVYIVYNMIFH